MQNGEVAVKCSGDLFGDIAERISHPFAGAETGENNEIADSFMLQSLRLELVFEDFKFGGMIHFTNGKQGFQGLQIARIRANEQRDV